MADHSPGKAFEDRDVKTGTRRAAIIDIGSNSVRLVVYAGPTRAPQPIFNEKLMVGLGSSLATTGAIEKRAFDRAIAGLARFKALVEAMEIADLRCVATAAVRDASNGDAFLAAARDIGLDIALLSGRDEARASGMGVISAIPDANGIVADLGGGSLELVRVRDGSTRHHTSFPLGVLRLEALQQKHGNGFSRAIMKKLAKANWPGDDHGLPLYLVGGSWRALARYDMMLARDAMPVVSGHIMPVSTALKLHRRLRSASPTELARIKGLSSARVGTIPAAAALLIPLVQQLQSSRLIVSASGLREGLLYQDLPPNIQAQDPLIVAAEAEGRRFARFEPHGAVIDQWIAPLFKDDPHADARLRLATCYLSDIASTANPDFRADRALEMALHGHWLGIDLSDRLVLAQALFSSAGGGLIHPFKVPKDPVLVTRLDRAARWGLAIRLAQRLSGGTAAAFTSTRLSCGDKALRLHLSGDGLAYSGEQVEKRLRQLGDALGLQSKIERDN